MPNNNIIVKKSNEIDNNLVTKRTRRQFKNLVNTVHKTMSPYSPEEVMSKERLEKLHADIRFTHQFKKAESLSKMENIQDFIRMGGKT
jgi:hypothetical protein